MVNTRKHRLNRNSSRTLSVAFLVAIHLTMQVCILVNTITLCLYYWNPRHHFESPYTSEAGALHACTLAGLRVSSTWTQRITDGVVLRQGERTRREACHERLLGCLWWAQTFDLCILLMSPAQLPLCPCSWLPLFWHSSRHGYNTTSLVIALIRRGFFTTPTLFSCLFSCSKRWRRSSASVFAPIALDARFATTQPTMHWLA